MRRYVNLGVAELEALANANWSNEKVLRDLQAELNHRTVPRARKLSAAVEDRLSEAPFGSGARPRAGEQQRRTRGPDEANSRVEAAERAADDLRAKVEELQERLSVATDPDYMEVFLQPGAPDFAIKAVRKAFQVHYHPDRRAGATDEEKMAAEEVLKRFEQAFHRIEARRATRHA